MGADVGVDGDARGRGSGPIRPAARPTTHPVRHAGTSDRDVLKGTRCCLWLSLDVAVWRWAINGHVRQFTMWEKLRSNNKTSGYLGVYLAVREQANYDLPFPTMAPHDRSTISLSCS